MKRMLIILFIMVLLIFGGVLWWKSQDKNNYQPQNNTSNYQAERSMKNTNINSNLNKDTMPVIKKEKEISAFTTKVFNKDKERQNNIDITCKALSTKEVQPGEIFSFCETVGKATSDKGYQEADIYVDGKKEQGLGGGMCQVSTTLYNAVLQVSELEVLERHEHSGHVPYIQEGKDAAISYGTYDFKFKNNTGSAIKIVLENTVDYITARIIKI